MEYQKLLNQVHKTVTATPITGKVASYIPELAEIKSNEFGMHLCCLDRGDYSIGTNEKRFSIQSISKVFSLTLALQGNPYPMNRVDVEPSGDPFNSLMLLEQEQGIPRNPLINSGALVISDILVSNFEKPKEAFLSLLRNIGNSDTIAINPKVFASEKAHSHRNRSLLHLMKSFGNIKNDIAEVLDLYIFQCSIEMSCKELASAFLCYANGGKTLSDEQILTPSQTKRLNAIMQTCGFYDEAGEFSFRVGLPGKSGVGGGIAAVHPGQYAVTTWSPPLNPKGNSDIGMLALEELTTLTGFSVF